MKEWNIFNDLMLCYTLWHMFNLKERYVSAADEDKQLFINLRIIFILIKSKTPKPNPHSNVKTVITPNIIYIVY